MTLLDHALWYLRQGFSVFPVSWDAKHEKRKSPLITSWEPYQHRLPTEDEVREWWTKWPDAGIAMVTGKISGVIVLDEESDADRDYFGLADYDETPIAKSGSGGRHFWFAYEPQDNRTKFVPGHDFRGDGGYVLVPPSPHESGNTYEWVVPWGSVELAPLPVAVRHALAQPKNTIGKDVASLLASQTGEGSRNESLASIVGSILARFKPIEWETKAWPLVKGYNQEHLKPPLEEHEVRGTFDSIAKKESKRRATEDKGIPTYQADDLEPEIKMEGDAINIRAKVSDGVAEFCFSELEQSRNRELDSTLVVKLHVPGGDPKPFSGRLNTMSMSAREGFSRALSKSFGKEIPWDLLLSRACESLRQEWQNRDESYWIEDAPDDAGTMLFDPFLADGGANVYFGKGGSNKTFIALRIAVSYGLGVPFLDSVPVKCGRVLFIDFEDTGGNLKKRVQQICKGTGVNVPFEAMQERLRYVSLAGSVPDNLPKIQALIKRHEIGLVVIDSAVQACGGEPERAEVASRYFNALRALGTTTLTIAHETKMENHAYPFGSVFFWNSPRNIWNVQCDSEDDERIKQVGLFHRKNNNGPIHKAMALKVFHGEGFTDIGWGDRGLWEKELSTGERILRRLKEKDRMDKFMLYKALEDVNKETVDKTMQRLRKAGKIVCYDETNGIWGCPPGGDSPRTS